MKEPTINHMNNCTLHRYGPTGHGIKYNTEQNNLYKQSSKMRESNSWQN